MALSSAGDMVTIGPRILHVVPSFRPDQGGLPAVAVRLAAAQAALGCRAAVLAYGDNAAIAVFNGVPGFERVTCEAIPVANLLERVTAPRARHRMNRLMPDFDYVHIHGVRD